jgi:hypothetical protein
MGGPWEISREAMLVKTSKEWAMEVRRLQAALIVAGICHADWHERNVELVLTCASVLLRTWRARTLR